MAKVRMAMFAPGGVRIKKPQVASLQPEIGWGPFPNRFHLAVDAQEKLSGWDNVSYELRVWRIQNQYLRYELVYQKAGITQPFARVEKQLESHCEYSWSVRARTVIEGRQRVTRWYNNSLLVFVTPGDN